MQCPVFSPYILASVSGPAAMKNTMKADEAALVLTVPHNNAYSMTPQLQMSTSGPAYNLGQKTCWCKYNFNQGKHKMFREKANVYMQRIHIYMHP